MPGAIVTIQGFAQVGALAAPQSVVVSGIHFVSDLAHEDDPANLIPDACPGGLGADVRPPGDSSRRRVLNDGG